MLASNPARVLHIQTQPDSQTTFIGTCLRTRPSAISDQGRGQSTKWNLICRPLVSLPHFWQPPLGQQHLGDEKNIYEAPAES